MRLSEIYLSVQGEGPNVGVPTVFVRFGGCNLRCPGWPCDTPYAIDPATYRHEWETMDVDDVVSMIKQMAGWLDCYNVCLTGGEPFLQKKEELEELAKALWQIPEVETVECFSNGTLVYPSWTSDYINFIMDWKLPGSGEDPENKTRLRNLEHLNLGDSVKFVCKDRDDFNYAHRLWTQYLQHRGEIEVYYGVVWDAMENSDLIELVLANGLPWRLNVQVHNYVFDRNKRGI